MAIQRMEHVGIVVDDLAAATAFFVELGLKVQGEQLSALLRPRPGGDHRRAGGAARLIDQFDGRQVLAIC
jgi:catechol 2,3-dioxygenase-like lactoylglutathione lyase family enzyme